MGKDSYLQSSLRRDPKPIEARIFVKDPSYVTADGRGFKKIELQGEPWLGAGPTSSRLRVVDIDDDTEEEYAPAGVLASGTGFDVGRSNPATSYQFHQVNLWATTARVLEHLESAKLFGRRIPWAFPQARLVLRPHAGVAENAYYDRESGGLHFFYFEGPKGDTIYTCLSHDIVAHELGHAVLDGLKPLYGEISSPDAGGFHEYFGDALAMTSTLTLSELVAQVVGKAPKTLNGRNLVSDIAREFGSAISSEPYLRTAENRITMAKLAGNYEEHDYSLVLTGAFYDVLQKIYARELSRRQRTPGNRAPGQLAVASLISAANYTSRLMLRGVDYCPPAGLSYREYARAVLRADEVVYPVDSNGYRKIVADVFVKRGIAKSVRQLAPTRVLENCDFRPYDVAGLAASATDAYTFVDRNREALGVPRDVDLEVKNVYQTRKVAAKEHFPPRETIVEFTWTDWVELRGSGYAEWSDTWYPMYCGGTLVFDGNNNLLHYTLADASKGRRSQLRKYLKFLVASGVFDEGDSEHMRMRASVTDGHLALVRRPAMRHAGRR